MSEWDEVPLRDVCTKIGSGATPTGGEEAYKVEGITLIRSMNVYDFAFIHDGLAHIDDAQATRLNNVTVQANDVLLNITGASVGRCCIVPVNVLPARVNQHVSIIRVNPSLAEPLFVLYTINSPYYKNMLLNRSITGATREALTKEDISQFKIPLPPLPIQRKIAAVLSAYDDLIENNSRRIALLERMAEEVYREWFVRLRFPGYAGVPAHNGVPEGWEIVPVDGAFEITGGGTPSKEEPRYWDGGDINWYTPTDITAAKGIFLTNSGLQCTDAGLSNSSARLFSPYCIMMTSRATIGALGINTTPACTNQGFITCIPNQDFPFTYLYHWLKLNKTYFELLSTGSTFLELIKSNFKRIEIPKPAREVVQAYHNITLPMFRSIETLLQENSNLKSTRDMLLARLLSGKVDVEALAIAGVGLSEP